jgi:hypothetical protein
MMGVVQQRWFVVESQERKQSDLKKLDKTLSNQTSRQQTQLQQLCTQEFACEADALAALKKFEQKLVWHELENVSIKQQRHYEKPGKPKQDTVPSRITYHPQASLKLNSEVVMLHQQRERRLRQALQRANQTLPNQWGKGRQQPTFRWIFQCFMAVHDVVLNGVKQVVNLTDERRRILQFFGSIYRQSYLLS